MLESRLMRRLIAIFVLAFLPLQWSYAAVASYCEHEQAPKGQQHLGHHELPGSAGLADEGNSPLDKSDLCSICYIAFAKVVLMPDAMLVDPSSRPSPHHWAESCVPQSPPDSLFRPPQGARQHLPA
jgi:hypothetical protein